MKPLHVALVTVAAAVAVGTSTFLLVRDEDTPSASQPTSTTLPSSPGAGWTEEEMRNARPGTPPPVPASRPWRSAAPAWPRRPSC